MPQSGFPPWRRLETHLLLIAAALLVLVSPLRQLWLGPTAPWFMPYVAWSLPILLTFLVSRIHLRRGR